jgi:hypothetical protein
MNAHSLRSLFSHRNAVPFTIFLLAGIVVCGYTAGTGPLSAEASVGQGRSNQRPPEFANRTSEDARKDFDDDDLKVKDQKPQGRWTTGLVSDMEQYNDNSVPVVVGAIQSLAGGGKYAGVFKVKRLEIKNRSSKAVNSVQLRWSIVRLDDPTKVLLEDDLPFVNFWAEADSSKVIEIPPLYPLPLFKALAKDGELNGQFKVTIGVQEARFADGSFWRGQEPVASFKVLYYDQTAASRFPQLASVSPVFPSFWADPGGSPAVIKRCEAGPGLITPAFSSMPYQETTCHDDKGLLLTR